MRHRTEGTPYVPPPCPTEKTGDMPNLWAASFRLFIDTRPRQFSEVYGTFKSAELDKEGEPVAEVFTDSLRLSPDDPLEQNIRRLNSTRVPSSDLTVIENPLMPLIGAVFCGRVANCQEVIDGECWAIGQKATKEVIAGILETYGEQYYRS